MSDKIQISIENEFVNSNTKTSEEVGATVFSRSFRKLNEEEQKLGKLFPVYIKIDDIYYVLGIFALNESGTTSLFLELPEGTFFDHITFGKALSKGSIHLTHITEKGRKKVTTLDILPLENGTQLFLTLIISDISILKLAPRRILYPPVNIKHKDSLMDSFITKGGYSGSGILAVEGDAGAVIVQFFVFPKEIDFKRLTFSTSGFIDPLASQIDETTLRKTRTHQIYLGHEFQNEFNFGLIALRYPLEIEGPAHLSLHLNKSGLYFNSADQDLNESILGI